MDSDFSQVAILILLIFIAAFYSACETSFANYNKSKMKSLAVNSKDAELVLKLDDECDDVMLTILISKSIFIVSAASISVFFLSKAFSKNSLIISTVITVFLILLFVELIPKGLAIFFAEKISVFAVNIIRLSMFILKPINLFLNYVKKVSTGVFKHEAAPTITEDELITMIDEVENEGFINKTDSDLIRSAIEFSETVVEDIYTPRIDIVGIEENEDLELIKQTFLVSGYSRLPVYLDDMDNIVGVLHEKDFYHALSRGNKDIKKFVQKVIFVTPNKKISELLRELQKNKAHMAVVIDEYGGTDGIVTMEDIIEELVGEIWDEHDEVVEWFKKLGEDKYLVSCNADVEDMFELLGMEFEDELDVTTVNGWITMLFEEIPEVGNKIQYKDLIITITKAEAKKVLEIRVEKIIDEKTLNI